MKSRWIEISIFISLGLATLAPQLSAADDENQTIEAKDVLFEKTYSAGKSLKPLQVRVHRAGHLENRPYVLEVNELCPTPSSPQDLIVPIDAYSACDIATNTIEYNSSKSELVVLVRDPRTEDAPRTQAGPSCATRAKRLIFKLESGCSR